MLNESLRLAARSRNRRRERDPSEPFELSSGGDHYHKTASKLQTLHWWSLNVCVITSLLYTYRYKSEWCGRRLYKTYSVLTFKHMVHSVTVSQRDCVHDAIKWWERPISKEIVNYCISSFCGIKSKSIDFWCELGFKL